MLELEKAQRVSLTLQVELRLKNALIVGSLEPGARLITKEIAEQLGTSITPVREALLRLVSSGALEATPAQAFLVPKMTLDKYREITLIRKNLEMMAVMEAAKNIDEEKLGTLRTLYSNFSVAKTEGQVEPALQSNLHFRFTLYSYAQMPTLMGLIEQLWVRMGPSFHFLYPLPGPMLRGPHNYDELLKYLADKNQLAASENIGKIIDGSMDVFMREYLI